MIRGFSNVINRRFMPARDEPPNVEIELRRPARLNLYPFRWFRQLVLTLDRPAVYLASLPDHVTVHGDRGGEDPPPKSEPYAFREKAISVACLIVIAAGTIYWIGWDG